MIEIQAYKMDGLGNDFIIIDRRKDKIDLSKQQIINIADRKKGPGCDQIIIIDKDKEKKTNAKITFYNSDGGEKGTLAIMVGGEKKMFNTILPLFKSMGTAIYVGKTGCGQVAKLANQTIVGISIGAVSEALILAEAAGADPKAVREIMLRGFAGGPILQNHGLRILTKNFKPGGKASTQLKDMNNIIATAKKYKLNLPIAKKVQELYAKTVKSGRANLDHSALYLFIKALSR